MHGPMNVKFVEKFLMSLDVVCRLIFKTTCGLYQRKVLNSGNIK
jgi:hypothetical protein